MPKPRVRAWSDSEYLGRDHRTSWVPVPSHYPLGSKQNPGTPRDRIRAAYEKLTTCTVIVAATPYHKHTPTNEERMRQTDAEAVAEYQREIDEQEL